MKIIRAGLDDTDIFSKDELEFGACCFFSEDKSCRYFFQIKGREAKLFTNTTKHIPQAIDEFLFYSGFVTAIKDERGNTLISRTPGEPFLCEVTKIQPSQFYINEAKLDNCKKWITKPDDIFIPIALQDNAIISLDGHTRMKAALELGYDSVYVYHDEYDEGIFRFVNEAVKRQIRTVADMKIISNEEYRIKWDGFCDTLYHFLP
jgi:hypothetical protein